MTTWESSTTTHVYDPKGTIRQLLDENELLKKQLAHAHAALKRVSKVLDKA